MAESPQNYSNHVRFDPLFHYVAGPLLLLNLVWSLVNLVMRPNLDSMVYVPVAFALVIIAFLVRTYPLKAQDRIIRLEEKLRYQQVLSLELSQKASTLKVNQIVALRFASDAELAGLIEQILAGKLNTSAEIKSAIKNWRADNFRI